MGPTGRGFFSHRSEREREKIQNLWLCYSYTKGEEEEEEEKRKETNFVLFYGYLHFNLWEMYSSRPVRMRTAYFPSIN
jgi:hypothetical protein